VQAVGIAHTKRIQFADAMKEFVQVTTCDFSEIHKARRESYNAEFPELT